MVIMVIKLIVLNRKYMFLNILFNERIGNNGTM